MGDKVIDKYGNKKCSKCGTHYGKACQKCCDHKVEIEDTGNYAGIIIICNKCLKEFTISEFDNNYKIIARKK